MGKGGDASKTQQQHKLRQEQHGEPIFEDFYQSEEPHWHLPRYV